MHSACTLFTSPRCPIPPCLPSATRLTLVPHAQDEVDLLLEEAIEEEADEALDVDLATEILTAPPPYATEEDDHRDFNVQLSPVPSSLAREL